MALIVNDLILGDDGLARPYWAATDELLRNYYDTEWGLPVLTEQGMFERLSLECFQAGLSWSTILRKRESFRAAFDNFDPEFVSRYDETQLGELMENPAIIRNRAKIVATVTNAQATLRMRESGGLVDFVWSFQPVETPKPTTYAEIPTQSAESIALTKGLKAQGFKFIGPTMAYALMEAIGMVDTHLVGSFRRGSSGIWS